MIIRKLQASFGKLQNETLRFHGGLNVIYAPNESGKSTWCAFIRAMLYGIDSSERARAGSLPDKQRYAPWSGAPMEGSMDVTADGFDMTLQRTTVSRSAPMREFSAVYTGSNRPVEGMTGSNCGELLTGINREVFRRSAFIEQGGVAVKGSPELEKRIHSIVSSGDEQTSFSEADARLKAWQHKRRYHRKGLLPALEVEMDETQRRLSEMDSSVDAANELEAKLEAANRECAALEEQVSDARRRQRTEAMRRLRDGRSQVQARSDDHDAALLSLSQSRDALRRNEFGNRSAEELEAEVRQDRAFLSEAEAESKPGLALLPAVAFSILAVVLAAFYGMASRLPLILGAGLCCIGAVIFFLRYSRSLQASREAQAERGRLLRKYGISVPEDLDRILAEREALEAAISQAEEAERASRERLDRAGQELHRLEEEAVNDLDFTGGDSEAARLNRRLQQKRAEVSALTAHISGISGKLSAMGDPMVLTSSLSALRSEYETIQDEYDAITLAQELLREADTEIQNRFSPELGRVAAQYMSEMTGGRYEDILIGQDFSARTRTRDDTVARDSEYLSAGTLDLMYLAVRLAVCELALPEGEPCPLILDDALVNLDETREAQAMKLLRKLALKRQIILFTCRKPAGWTSE
ncbi:MAG: AAA family ATPase [Oscillospiraceae bacterium]|nr:AAA family ATPase [Oscillospiraceae bacterium]